MSTSERKRPHTSRFLFGVALVAVGVYAVASGIIGLNDDRSRLFALKGIITIEFARSAADRQKGLSGREELSASDGMLFVFEESGMRNCFWMKDMNFAIDMIWMDDNKKVLNVQSHVAPETYPESFCPEGDAKYGLEVKAGQAEKLGIKNGETLRF